jgi:hypothetical protein
VVSVAQRLILTQVAGEHGDYEYDSSPWCIAECRKYKYDVCLGRRCLVLAFEVMTSYTTYGTVYHHSESRQSHMGFNMQSISSMPWFSNVRVSLHNAATFNQIVYTGLSSYIAT